MRNRNTFWGEGSSSGSFLVQTIIAILSGILGGVIVLVLSSSQSVTNSPYGNQGGSQSGIEPSESLIAEDEAVINVVEKVSPSVVSIIITREVSQMDNFFRSPFDFFFDPFGGGQDYEQDDGGTTERQVGGGTGFFVTEDGMIITNKHVVDSTGVQYTVITQDGQEYNAEVLALDPIRDLAVIKINPQEGENFPVVELGESKSIRVGQTVVAIGYSLGEFANSISKGIVSGLGRSILAGSAFGRTERLSDIIQTDAAINPGNSGGPLLDIYGRVIGVNVAVAQDAENVGFALPIDPVRDIIKQVQETGEISTPFLGVRYMIIDEYIARENNLQFDYGALVLRGTNRSDLAVVPGSPANKAGIEENDIILEIGGERVTEDMPLESIISKYNVGDEVALKIWSEGKTQEKTVVLDKRS